MRFSLITSTPNEMYAFNPFINTPAVAPLTMEAFVAPANFDPDAQELNIVKAFAAYPNANKKYIFSVGTSTSTVLPAVTGRSYAYSENGGAYTTIASGTVTWTVGSTKRNVVVIDSASSVIANIYSGGIWLYISDKCYSITSLNNTSLKYIHCQIRNSITNLGNSAFLNCALSGLLTLSESITNLDASVFQNCVGLVGNLIIPNSVKYVGYSIFKNCTGFTSLKLSDNLEIIQQHAFIGCTNMLGNLLFPSTLEYLGTASFAGCNGFTGSLIIPDSVTYMGPSVFEDSHGFTDTLTLSNNLTTIREVTFFRDNFSGELIIPNSVTEIKYWAFYNSKFTSLVLGSGLTLISSAETYGAFQNCSLLALIKSYNPTPPVLGAPTFTGVNKTIPLHVPIGSLAAYQAAPYWNAFTNIIADL